MIEVFKYEAEDEESCRLKCLEELDVYNNEILVKELEVESGYSMEVVKKEDVKAFIKEYLETVAKSMGIDLKLEVNEYEDIFTVKMFSNKNPILIGKDGRTLTSLQLLIRQSLNNMTGFNIKVNLDASNYKARKERFFESDIKKIINEVITTKDEIKLDPMNSYKRRLVHSVAADYYNIET